MDRFGIFSKFGILAVNLDIESGHQIIVVLAVEGGFKTADICGEVWTVSILGLAKLGKDESR